MTTINPAFSFDQLQGDLGLDHVFAQQEILETLKDELNVLGLGVVPLQGDLVGSGSDTLRITNMGNIGFDVPMDALATETSSINPKTITTGFSTVAIALFGLGHSETYKNQVLGREIAVTIDELKKRVPESWLATFRSLVATAGAGFATAVGSATQPQSVDDWIDLATVYREQLGSARRGPPTTFLAPAQVTQSVASARNEPAFQNSINDFQAIQGLDMRQVIDNFLGLGFRVAMTDDVTQSGGAHQGFAFSMGGVGWAVASTNPIRPSNPQGAMLIPEFGLIIEEVAGAGTNGKRAYEARSFFGVAAGSSDVHVQRRVIALV